MNQLLSQLYYIQLHLAQLNSTFQTRLIKLELNSMQLIRFELNSILTYQTQTYQTRLIKFKLNYIQLIKLIQIDLTYQT